MTINRLLKQVREHRRFRLEDVASYAHISLTRLEAFEAGERDPSHRQIQRLADVYGLPSYLLASRALPNLPETLLDFRRKDPGPAHLTPPGMRRIWAAEKASSFANQLADELKYAPPEWSRSVPSGDPTPALANKLRSFFDEWLAARNSRLGFTGTPEQVFLGGFRTFLEVQGTIVNTNNAPSDDFLGFYIHPDDGLPLTFVNRSISSRKAQLFTAVHEYAHSLLDAPGVSNPFLIANAVERKCNHFAAEFLAPMASFRPLVEQQSRTVLSNPTALVRAVAGQSLLSQHATAIRLVEGKYLSQEQLRAWERAVIKTPNLEKQEEAEAAGEGHGVPHAKRIAEVGYLPTYLSKLAIERRLIDSLDVQAGLSLSEGLQESAFSLVARRFDVAR
jgi:Zn-dependent peptidase ImmA (M78 family)/transcriptional regulator with XRE-family HTH domain